MKNAIAFICLDYCRLGNVRDMLELSIEVTPVTQIAFLSYEKCAGFHFSKLK